MFSHLSGLDQHGNLIDMDDDPPPYNGAAGGKTQQILIDEEYSIQQLQEREQSIRQLEVQHKLKFEYLQKFEIKT